MSFKGTNQNHSFLKVGMILCVILLYSLLATNHQDIFLFLTKTEPKVSRIFQQLTPILFFISLIFIQILVYYSYVFLIEEGKEEIGVYLALGMSRKAILWRLFKQSLKYYLEIVIIGLPIGMLVTEFSSIIGGNIIGLSIQEHVLSFHFSTILYTLIGFFIVQIIALALIYSPIYRSEPSVMLFSNTQDVPNINYSKRITVSKFAILLFLILGISLYVGIRFQIRFFSFDSLFNIILFVITTSLFYYGFSEMYPIIFQIYCSCIPPLSNFTMRQVQEKIRLYYKNTIISCFMLVGSFCLMALGLTLLIVHLFQSHICDFSFYIDNQQQITNIQNLEDSFETIYPIYVSKPTDTFEYSALYDKDLAIVTTIGIDYIIPQSSYNILLIHAGLQPMSISDHTVAVFSNFRQTSQIQKLYDQLHHHLTIKINQEIYQVDPFIYSDRLVADRGINIYTGLIIPDSLYRQFAKDPYPYAYNAILKSSIVHKDGLIHSIENIQNILDQHEIRYDSYLNEMARRLVMLFIVTYFGFYFGLLFLFVANILIGIRFMIHNRTNHYRYHNLRMIGTNEESIEYSIKRQVLHYFLSSFAICGIASIAIIACLLYSYYKYLSINVFITILFFIIFVVCILYLGEYYYMHYLQKIAIADIQEI